MRTLFSRMPIRLKLISFFSAILLFSTVFNFLYYPEIHKKKAMDYIKAHLDHMAGTVALSTGISLELMDFSSIGLAINWAKQDPNLSFLGIFDPEKEEIGVFNPNQLQLDIPGMLSREGPFEIDGNIYTLAPINYGKTHHGKILIGLSLNELNADIQKNKKTTLYISLGILLFGILISIFISNMISKPLVRLTEAAQEVGQGNYSIQITPESSDEVGTLARAFQIMTGKINQTMDENARINHQLEDIIADLTEMGTTLSAEKDLGKLLDMIVSKARHLTHADAGTLYLVERGKLEFKIIHNDTLNIKIGAQWGDEIPFRPLEIVASNVSGYVALNKKYLNIRDVYASDDFDLTGPKTFDQKNRYHSQSMLVMPLLNLDNETVGVLQLINSLDPKTGQVVPFPQSVEKLVHSLASQAAVAITNLRLKKKTEGLLEEVTSMKDYNESILESMPNGVVTLDSQNRITKYNAASARILNLAEGELIGRSVGEWFSDEKGWLMKIFHKVLETGQPEIILDRELPVKNNSTVFANITISPLKNVKKEPIGAMVVFEDITREKRVQGTLAKFMPKEVADKVLEDGEFILGGQMQEAAVLFSDIRNFTTLAETLSPQDTVDMLNEYFDIMVELVFVNEGSLDKFIGDSLLAVFGVPFKGSKDSENAVRTSIAMIHALKIFNLKRVNNNKNPIRIGIGINTANVLAGNIGTLKRMDYTIIGDGVNLASRLESANKFFGTQILISHNTYSVIKDNFLCREIDLIKVKGRDNAVSIYEVLDVKDAEGNRSRKKILDIFHEGLNFYRSRKWKEGIKKFNQVLSLNPNDKVTQIYVGRCKFMMENPPEKNWDAVWVMDTK